MRTRYPDLVLKRGLLTDSKVVSWVMDALQNRQFTPANVLVSLLNEQHQPLMTWVVQHAWPRKWSVADFNAQENAIAVESMEFSYTHFTMTSLNLIICLLSSMSSVSRSRRIHPTTSAAGS